MITKRVRLFPALLVVLVGSLLFKIAAVNTGVQSLLSERPAEAQDSDQDTGQESGKKDSGSAGGEAVQGQAAASPPGSPYPENWTREEVDLMLNLAERKKELDARETAIRDRELILAGIENRINGKIEELSTIEATIQTMLTDFDEEQQTKFMKLKSMIEIMKDGDAAEFLEGLDMESRVAILRELAPKKASSFLAKMDRDVAVRVAVELASVKDAPSIDEVRAAAGDR